MGQRLGFRFCTHCSAPLPADAAACILCGQQRTPSARDLTEALTQRGYSLSPEDDSYTCCRNCSAPMLQRNADGLCHCVCPECGFTTGVLTCTLSALERTPSSDDSQQPPGTACHVLVQRHSGAEELFSCRVLPGEEVRLRPGQQVVLYFTCGKLYGIQELSSRTIYHIIGNS